ncbi:MAG: family 10 glycosylhydrolase [Clostridia bacterium]|nr:family 10 glycosylhydrolase [Clostridia bacterium]
MVTTKPTTVTTTGSTVSRPSVGDEMRGAWVSYIELSELLQRCSTPAQARKALDDMMASLASYNINTVFFHVRANSDAYYKSALFEPAAAAKKLLNAGFDPLAYAVTAAHAQGMQLHAWVNPYRVGTQTAYLVDGIPTMTDAAGRYYYVPTSTAAQTLILNGIRELLDNYDIDGIQYDDYFYPDSLLKEATVYSFESADYEAYKQAGGTLTVGNWRRAGVDMLISSTHTLTAAKGVTFGVSPAVNADNTYKALYADCRKWLSQPGYVDYLCPQIYTGFENSSSAFDKMVDTWRGYQRHASVDLYFGLALYKIGLKSDTYAGAGKTEWADHSDVMKRSVQYLRDKQVSGLAFYSYSYFDPATKAGLSATADVAVAEQEIKNLLSIL